MNLQFPIQMVSVKTLVNYKDYEITEAEHVT